VTLERLVGDDLLQLGVLALELLEPLRLVDLHAAVLAAPAVIRLLAHTELPHHLADRLALRKPHLGFTQLADDLLGSVPLSLRHQIPPSSEPPRFSLCGWIGFRGAGHLCNNRSEP
jgi:hypothetical protein